MATRHRGRAIPLSVPRQIIIDLMHFASRVPSVPAERRMNLSAVVAARQRCTPRPSWSAIFIKAYALVAREVPELRRIYFGLPWQRCVEFAHSTASVAIEIQYGGEAAVFPCVIDDPASLPLAGISDTIRKAVESPADNIPLFDTYLAVAKLPVLVRWAVSSIVFNMPARRATRFGTFALTSVASHGTELLHPLSAWPTLLTYGVLAADGTIAVRIVFDHRVMDGYTVARVLLRLEEMLNGAIVRELQGG
jgi:hypothetical protein